MKPIKPASFPQGKILEVQRSLGLGGPAYWCPHCSASFNQEPKCWSHVKETHRSSLRALGSSKEAEDQERERYKQWASEKAHGKSSTLKLPSAERTEDRGIAGPQKLSGSPQRPSTAPDDPSKGIKHSGGLSTGDIVSPVNNPRKRGPGPGSSSETPSGREQITHLQSRPKHTKAASNSQAIDKDFQRQRNPSLSATRLFDYKTDDATSRTLPRKAKTSSTFHRGQHQHASKNHISNPTKQAQYESARDTRLPPQVALGTTKSIQVLQPKSTVGQKATDSKVPETPPPDSDSLNIHVEDPIGPDDPEPDTSMLRQPETRPISHDQLVVEVKGIYAGLVMVEAKCIEVDEKQTTSATDKDGSRKQTFTNDQWRSLIALHKQLLHEHHDFFLASQHPSASSNLSKLAAKYSMPARMWRHGIHAFLEVLRHRLPQSLDHMLAFIYIAYSMMALLYETVPSFEDTWIECLGDLGRYRMAIEDDEPRDREVWSNVAKYWYSKASDKSPTIGRLYHHLAILAKPYSLEQLSLYERSLTSVTPFESARGSIMTLLNPILAGRITQYHRASEMEIKIIKAHGILFTYPQRPLKEFELVIDQLKGGVIDAFFQEKKLNEHKWKKVGAFLALSNVSSIFENGALTGNGKQRSPLRRSFEIANVRKERELAEQEAKSTHDDISMQDVLDLKSPVGLPAMPADITSPVTPTEAEYSSAVVSHASELAFLVLDYAFIKDHWTNDSRLWVHLLPLVHVMMVFINSCALIEVAIHQFECFIPWNAMCIYLNQLAAQPGLSEAKVRQQDFPTPNFGIGRPLWEDYLLRGLLYTLWYFPQDWFSDAGIDDEERQLEAPSMDDARAERVLWLGHRIAAFERWIRFNKEDQKFEVTENAPKTTTAQTIFQSNISSVDSAMTDAPASDLPSSTSIEPNEAPEARSISSSTTTLTQDTPAPESLLADPTTPRANVKQEHDDVSIIDMSTRKGEQSDLLATSIPMQFETPPVYDPGTSPP